MSVEADLVAFEILDFVYGDVAKLEAFIRNYGTFKDTQKYVVVESSGYGRQLKEAPILEDIGSRKIVTIMVQGRTEYGDPNKAADARLVFTDNGMDLDLKTDDGWITGKRAVIQSVQMLLGSNRGQWGVDPDFGSYLYIYYRDHHANHELLQRLIKIEISRMISVPDGISLVSAKPSIPVSTIKWVEGVTIRGHSMNLLEIDLRLYFSDDTYFSERIHVPATIAGKKST
jgi:hypothetical protein